VDDITAVVLVEREPSYPRWGSKSPIVGKGETSM
jgi:hypothetical protein